ncbi:hypothetical protein ABZ763_27490 [Streptomyces bacillaris]|uniref:DUF7848 domain-containing protein n=1 Tax=Streptomyces bacillaris TaxID=68179 RepID=UPI00345F35D8
MTRSVFRFQPYTTQQDLTVEPEYSAECVAGDDDSCGARSGTQHDSGSVDDWMRAHMKSTGHRYFRRSFEVFAELIPATALPAGLEPARVERVRM